MLVLSANNVITDSILRTISLIKIKNNREASTDPWGTPEEILFSTTEYSPLITAAFVRSMEPFKQISSHAYRLKF